MTGPNVEGRLVEQRTVSPGRLHLYDVEKEKIYTIVTNQGDSEILLVEEGFVYYRVSDRLYRASIGESGIVSRVLLATHDAIRDAHWAFVKH